MGWRGSANSFGGILFPVAGGFLGTISWQMPFAIYLLGLMLGFLAVIFVPETYGKKFQYSGKKITLFDVFRKNQIILFIYSLLFLAFVFLYVIVVFLPLLLTEIGIANPFYIGLFIMAFATSVGLTALLYGKIKTRLSYRMIVLSTFGLWGLGFIGLSFSSSGIMILASVIPMGIGHGLISPAVNVWVGETVHISFRGRVVSYLTSFGYVGQFISPLIFGPVSLALGFNGVFLIAGIVCAPLFLLLLIFMKK
jgi:MFS family permease